MPLPASKLRCNVTNYDKKIIDFEKCMDLQYDKIYETEGSKNWSSIKIHLNRGENNEQDQCKNRTETF
jgi:hypothetical protein